MMKDETWNKSWNQWSNTENEEKSFKLDKNQAKHNRVEWSKVSKKNIKKNLLL